MQDLTSKNQNASMENILPQVVRESAVDGRNSRDLLRAS
jgi:hypothetical protein